MPSPQYVLIESTRVEKASQTQIESSDDPQSKDNDPLVTPYQDDQDLYLKPTTADACLQTSLNSTRETSDSVQVNHAAMDKARPNEQVSVSCVQYVSHISKSVFHISIHTTCEECVI